MNKTTLHWSYLNFKDVPMDLFLYEDLEEVYLKENFITTIPKWLLNVTTLKFIHLAGNNLSALPDEMYLLENLEFLDVSNNQIRELPTTIGLMERLQQLNVSGNELTALPTAKREHTRNMSTYFSYPTRNLQDELQRVATMLMQPGRGILISNQSPAQLVKELNAFGIHGCEEKRVQYRELLFSSKVDLQQYISGVVVHPDVLQVTNKGGCAPYCQLRRQNILVGISVNTGLVPLSLAPGEYTSQGLDGLDKRCTEYKEAGLDFSMWQAQFHIGEYRPSQQAIFENCNNLAKFAAISQWKRLLPILDIDIVSDGGHDLERSEKVTETILTSLFKSLSDHHVSLDGTLLKVTVLTPGPKCEKRYSPGQISKAMLRLLRRTVPAAVTGIVLSMEARTQEKATVQMNNMANDPAPKPWPLTFCCDNYMQSSVMMAWAGLSHNTEKAQSELKKIIQALSQAAAGVYVPGTLQSTADRCYCRKAINSLRGNQKATDSSCALDTICRPAGPMLVSEADAKPTEPKVASNDVPPKAALPEENKSVVAPTDSVPSKAAIANEASSKATIKSEDASKAVLNENAPSKVTINTEDASKAVLNEEAPSKVTIKSEDASKAVLNEEAPSKVIIKTEDSSNEMPIKNEPIQEEPVISEPADETN